MKKVKYILIAVISLILFSNNVNAASVSIRSSNTTITKGGSVTVTATVSSDSPIVSIEGTLRCKGAGANSGVDMEFDDVSNSLYSKSYSVTVKPSTSGTINCSVTGSRITSMSSGSWQNLGDKSLNITVKEPVYIPPKTYSSNNYLKSMQVDGYSLTPTFNKDTKEYSLEVPNGTTKIKINTELEDSTAKVSGTGEREVSEGTNKLEVKVTAENGNERVYIINVTVKELDPINVKVGKEDYTIIRKDDILEAPTNYEKTSIKMNNEDVLAYYNEKTKYTLVGLKNNKGDNAWYIYNAKKNTYELYTPFVVGGTSLVLLTMPDSKLPDGYSKVSFKYNDSKLDGYQYREKNVTYAADETVKVGDFYLVYAVNELSGEKGIYVYDKLENTIQRYNNTLALTYQRQADTYFLYFLITLALFAVSVITLTIVLIKKGKHKNKFA